MKPSLFIIVAFLLSACASASTPEIQEPKTTVRVITEPQKVDLPKILYPPDIKLEEFQFITPANPSAVVGLDQQNYRSLERNYQSLKARDQRWKLRVDEANRMRACLLENTQDVCLKK